MIVLLSGIWARRILLVEWWLVFPIVFWTWVHGSCYFVYLWSQSFQIDALFRINDIIMTRPEKNIDANGRWKAFVMIILETLSSDRISYNFDVKSICHGIKLQTFGFFPELLDIFNLIGLVAVQVRLILLKIMFYFTVIDWSHIHDHELIKVLNIVENLCEFRLTSSPLQMPDRCQICLVYFKEKI